MIIHSVYFWLDSSITAQQCELFENELALLGKIESVNRASYGKPSSTDRPVVERSYDYALVLEFESIADHDRYQVDPAHLDFINRCQSLWSQVKIFDVDTAL